MVGNVSHRLGFVPYSGLDFGWQRLGRECVLAEADPIWSVYRTYAMVIELVAEVFLWWPAIKADRSMGRMDDGVRIGARSGADYFSGMARRGLSLQSIHRLQRGDR